MTDSEKLAICEARVWELRMRLLLRTQTQQEFDAMLLAISMQLWGSMDKEQLTALQEQAIAHGNMLGSRAAEKVLRKIDL